MKKLILLLALLCPTLAQAAPGQLVDCATSPQSVAAGGTSQVQLATNNQRTTVYIENYCTASSQGIGTAESIFINFGSAAANGTGLELAPCGSASFPSNYPVQQSVNIFAATTGHRFACKANQ